MPDGIPLNKNACAVPDDILRSTRVADAASVQEVSLLINHFSNLIEGPFMLNRTLEQKTYNEIFNGIDTPWAVYVKAPPIIVDATLEVWDDPTGAFTDTTLKLTRNEDYYLQSAGPMVGYVCIRKTNYPFSRDYGNIKVRYNGGIVKNDPVEGTLIVPDDLRGLCVAQVTAWWQKAKNPNQKLQIVNGIHIGLEPYNLLPIVKMGLESRKRVVF